MSSEYYAIRGKKTKLTPVLTVESGEEHEKVLFRHDNLPAGQTITCGNSKPLPKGKRPDGKPFRHVFWDFTDAGDVFVTEKTKTIFESAAPKCVKFYPCTMSFMDTDEILFVMKAVHRIAPIDQGKTTRDSSGLYFTSVILQESFLSETPLEDRMLFEMIDAESTFAVHQSVLDALTQADITGFQAYPLNEWKSNPFKDPKLKKLGDHYYTGEPIN